jgi:hypothetical protein
VKLLIPSYALNPRDVTKIHTLAKKCAPNISNLMFHIILSFKSYISRTWCSTYLLYPLLFKKVIFIPHENIKSIIIIKKELQIHFKNKKKLCMQSIISFFSFLSYWVLCLCFFSFDKKSYDILLSTWLEEEKNIKAATTLKLG